MHLEEILQIREHRGDRFPIPRCEYRFFTKFDQRPHTITYDELMRQNFPIIRRRNLRQYFDDVQQTCGNDILAYYRPFHGSNDWGIHILDVGVSYLATRITELAEGDNIVLSRRDAEYLAKQKLLLHELGHHAVEIVHTLLEIHPDHPIRDSYRQHRSNDSSHENEEAVCNWNVKKNNSEFKVRALSYFNIISSFMNLQPPGYRDFGMITNQNFLENADIRLPMNLALNERLSAEFTQHSKLPRVRPSSVTNIAIGFMVPLYLIRT